MEPETKELEYDDREQMKLLAIDRLARETLIPNATVVLDIYPMLLKAMLCALYHEKYEWIMSELGALGYNPAEPDLTPEDRDGLHAEIVAAGRRRWAPSIPIRTRVDYWEHDELDLGGTFLGLYYDTPAMQFIVDWATACNFPGDTPMPRIVLYAEIVSQLKSEPLFGRVP